MEGVSFILYAVFLLLVAVVALFNWIYGNQIYHIEHYLKIYLPPSAQLMVRINRIFSWIMLLVILFFAALRFLSY